MTVRDIWSGVTGRKRDSVTPPLKGGHGCHACHATTPGGAKIASPKGPEGPRPFSFGKKFLPFDISAKCPNEGKTRVSAGFPMIGGNISPKAEFQTGLLFAANWLERQALSLIRVDCLIFQGGRG